MPIKILHLISNKAGIGGAEKHLLDMSEEYDVERFSISYCTVFSEGNDAFLDELRRRRFDCYELLGTSWTNLPETIRRLVSLMRRKRFDIVHTQLLYATIVGQLAARIAGVPIRIVTRHHTNDWYQPRHKHLNKLDAYVTRKATKVVAISGAVKNDLLQQGVPLDRIKLIYNGISLKLFDRNGQTNEVPQLKQAYPGKYLLAYTANLHEYKGHKFLIEALAKLSSKYTDIQLLLIGEGAERKNLEGLVARLKLKDKVTFLGYQPNVPALLKEIDLYIHPTMSEAFGIAVIEAMAAGKCVIASRVGGIPEIIEHGQTGFLVAPKDVTGLAEAILYARENLKLAQEIAEAGRERVKKKFSIQTIVNQYQQLYEACINSPVN